MNLSHRKRFILYVTCGYLFFGSTWIFLSDRMLTAFTNISDITSLSTAKGISFIILTALLLVLALCAIPDRVSAESQGRYRSSRFLVMSDQLPRWIAYVFAVAVTLTMLLVRMRIAVSYSERPMLILFMLPVILSSVLGGFGPGLTATAIASLGIDYYGIPPLHSLQIGESHDLFQWFMLIMSGILASCLSELLHRARRQSEERRSLQENAQDELKQSGNRFRIVSKLSSDFAYSCCLTGDGGYAVDWITNTFYVLTGISEAELKALRCWMNLTLPEDRDKATNPLHRLQPGECDTREFRIVAKDGRILTVTNRMECEADPSAPGGLRIYGSVQDITERKCAEEALRKSETHLQTLVQTIPDLIWLKDTDGVFLDCNKRFERLYGAVKKDIIGKTDYDFVDRELADFFRENDRKAMAAGRPISNEEWLTFADDGYRGLFDTLKTPMFNSEGDRMGVLGIARDITDLKRAEMEKIKLEAQLMQAQKMEAIGSLAGGIAHDLNNILFPISGLSEMLIEDLPPGSPASESIEQIHKSALRGRDLVKQILAFSRQSNPQKLPIRIQPILKDVLKLVRSTVPMNIEIKSHVKPDCGMVSADPTQVHQIVMNLITNAYHAVEENNGTIHVELKEIIFGKDDLNDDSMKPGKYACISVSDTGPGIEQSLIHKIFDPYFTTKAQGKGTGLGLSVVHGIVKQHNGDIRVNSEAGKETTFNVYLPLLEDVKDRKDAPVSRKHPTGCERILLVDDEEPVLRLEQLMLERLGYQILAQTNGPDALNTFRADPSAFDLVISDRGMPNMTGEQFAGKLIAIRPGIPIIICTGFSDENDERIARAIGVKGFLKKPISIGDLAEMVRKVLDGATI